MLVNIRFPRLFTPHNFISIDFSQFWVQKSDATRNNSGKCLYPVNTGSAIFILTVLSFSSSDQISVLNLIWIPSKCTIYYLRVSCVSTDNVYSIAIWNCAGAISSCLEISNLCPFVQCVFCYSRRILSGRSITSTTNNKYRRLSAYHCISINTYINNIISTSI